MGAGVPLFEGGETLGLVPQLASTSAAKTLMTPSSTNFFVLNFFTATVFPASATFGVPECLGIHHNEVDPQSGLR